MELGRASDMVTDAQSALGLSMDETTEMVNKMAMAASKSNTSVTQLGDAMLQIGGTAKKLKGGTTELATILGILADNGMKGAEGGTHLRNMMNSLMSPTKDATEMMEKLNVSLYDSEGNMRSLNDVFIDLRAAMSEMATQQERDKVITTIFNARDMKAAEAMLANVGARYNELSGYIDQAAGSAEKMANTQLDNLKGDMTLFKSAVESAQIAVSEKLEPTLRKFTKVGSQAVSEAVKAFGEHGLGAAIDAAKKAIYDGFGEETAKKIKGIKIAVEAAIAAFVTFKATVVSAAITKLFTDAATGAVSFAAGIGRITTALQTAGTALVTNPLFTAGALISAALVGLKVAFDEMTLAIEMPKNAYDELNEEQQKTVDGIRDIVNASKESRNQSEENAKAIDKQYSYYDKLKNTLFELDEAENLSADDKARMQAIVTELNGSLEGLNITLDAETGHLQTEKSAIEATIRAMEKKAKMAVYEERLIDAYRKQDDLQESWEKSMRGRADAANALMEKQKALSEATKEFNELQAARARAGGGTAADRNRENEAAEKVRVLTEQVEKAEDTLAMWREESRITHEEVAKNNEIIAETLEKAGTTEEEFTKKINEGTEALEAQGEAAEKVSEKHIEAGRVLKDAETGQVTIFANLKGKTVEWSEETVNEIAKIIDKYNEYRDKVEESVKGSVDIFGSFKRDTSTTFEGLMESMKDNKAGVEDWTKAIKALRDKGMLDDRIIDQWEEMGVASWNYLYAFKNTTKEQQAEFNKLWLETQGSMEQAVHQAVVDDKHEADKLLNELTDNANLKLGDYKRALNSFITTESDTYVQGVQEAIKNAEEVSGEIVEKVEGALNGIDSEGAGKSIMERFANALKTHAEPILEWAKQLGVLFTEGINPFINDNGQIVFPQSSVAPGGAALSDLAQPQWNAAPWNSAPNGAINNQGGISGSSITIPLTVDLDGKTIAKQTVAYNDYENGKLAERKALGYA